MLGEPWAHAGDMLTDLQIDLIQSSFARVRPIAEAAGMMFYDRIFTLAPEARVLFGDDIARQAERTMTAVGSVVDGLRDVDTVVPLLLRLGARHAGYGVQPAHFDVVGEALIWTLEQGLGDDFSAPAREAWSVAWHIITGTMLEGMSLASV